MMARAGLFVKSLVVCLALALIAYALSPWGLDALLKFLALAAGISILIPFIYPPLRGIRKGDGVSIGMGSVKSAPGMLSMLFHTSSGIAMENGRTGQKIMVAVDDGSIRSCVITGYEGFFSPAKVHIAKEQKGAKMEITVV
jgi:hypothetical protein